MTGIAREALEAFRSSRQFDERWYLEQYPDVKLIGMDPAEHYLWIGRRLGRSPQPSSANALAGPRSGPATERPTGDLAALATALANSRLLDIEYVCKQVGIPTCSAAEAANIYYATKQKRPIKPNPLFDPEFYRLINRLDSDTDPVSHFLEEGAAKHLRTHRLFDCDWYKSQLPEATDAPNLLEHYWRFGYAKGIYPSNPAKIAVQPEVAELFFSATRPEPLPFDATIYRSYNRDLAHLDDAGLHSHYDNFGGAEGRMADASAFLRAANSLPRFVPIDFNPKTYSEIHFDLGDIDTSTPWQTLMHYLKAGIAEGRHHNWEDLFPSCSDAAPSIQSAAGEEIAAEAQLCVLIHVYYPDLWGDLSRYIDNIPAPFDLYINLVDSTWTPEILSRIRSERPQAHVYISENTGRDIGGFMRLLDNIDIDRYLAFALVHSKHSPHVTRAYATAWRDNLLGAILGSPEIINQNLSAFRHDKTLGIIGSGRHRQTSVAINQELFDKLLDLFKIDAAHRKCEYVSGTIMMVRSEVLKAVYQPLRTFQFSSGDNKGLEHHMDGQPEHAIERVFGNVMKQLGFKFLWR